MTIMYNFSNIILVSLHNFLVTKSKSHIIYPVKKKFHIKFGFQVPNFLFCSDSLVAESKARKKDWQMEVALKINKKCVLGNSPHLYASFGTFYAKIGLLLEAQ